MDRWTKGRVALVGDAAACVSLLAGEGTGLAMAEAYVLSGELCACQGDHLAAFARYQQRMMPFPSRKQASAAKFATSFAPRTAVGVALRNVVTKLLGIPAGGRLRHWSRSARRRHAWGLPVPTRRARWVARRHGLAPGAAQHWATLAT
jgi:2-polyprenyl-6-methoxyphenol hydroxylase-like FAD-dependent oxidoreductase